MEVKEDKEGNEDMGNFVKWWINWLNGFGKDDLETIQWVTFIFVYFIPWSHIVKKCCIEEWIVCI